MSMRMNCLPLLHLMWLLDSTFSSLPAPVNLSINSVNFHHVLRWDPGPGTPPGTWYRIYKIVRVREESKRRRLSNSTTTSAQLIFKDPWEVFVLTVRAFYNQTRSNESPKCDFTPYAETKIGPPKLSLAGCGNCIQINISLPQPDSRSGIDDFHTFYYPTYRVSFKKHEGKEMTFDTDDRSFTLPNLQRGTEYCVKVQPMLRQNKNTQPSELKCTFTSTEEPSRGPVVFGSVAALVIFVIGGVMASMFCLYYTGFVCKLKATLPRTLIAALSRGYTLTPERTVPDRISISPQMDKRRRHNNAATPQPATGSANSEEQEDEDEDEEEDGINVYMDRAAELSSGESSRGGSVAANRTPAASGSAEAELAEFEVVHEGRDEDEAIDEGAGVSYIPEEGQTGVQGDVTDEVVEEEEEEEVCDSSGNVDLFSVTLGALAACEEEEEEEEEETRDSLTDLLKVSDVEPRDSGRTVSLTDSQTCDGETQHEEEEEEEFSGYMRHS